MRRLAIALALVPAADVTRNFDTPSRASLVYDFQRTPSPIFASPPPPR